jgi:hypothetical protein
MDRVAERRQSRFQKAERHIDRQRDGGDEPTGRVDVQTGRETRRLAENTCRQAVILVDRQWYLQIGSDTC